MNVAAEDAATKTEMAMGERLSSLDPGSSRYNILESALNFKKSWVALARQLVEVKKEKAFKDWGYRTFEAYCKHELHVKKETATKLVRSYDFLSNHEKPLLKAVEDGPEEEVPEQMAELPNYQALDILAEARENPNLPEEDYRELRDQVFNEDLPPNKLKKMVKERAPEPPKKQAEDPTVRLRKALSLAERLYGMLLEEQVPQPLCESAEQVVGGLRRLLEE